MRRLLALVALGGFVTLGGVTYRLFQPEEGVTRAQLLDAGFADVCAPAVIACEGRLDDDCRERPDGGLRPRYVTLRLQAIRCEVDGGQYLWPRFPRAQVRECFRPLRGLDESCVVVDATCASTPDICAAGLDDAPPWTAAQDACACRRKPDAGGGNCFTALPDGGPINTPYGVTVQPPFVGAGCVRKPCVEALGEWGASMPEECAP